MSNQKSLFFSPQFFVRRLFALGIFLCLINVAGCKTGDGTRYFYGEGKVITQTPSDPVGDNSWVAVLFKLSPDGNVEIKFGPMGGAVQGTGVLTGNQFSGQATQERGAGTVKLNGTLEETNDGGAIIAGTITRNPGESGQFEALVIEDIKDGEKMWGFY